MKIKTLAEILAESNSDSANSSESKQKLTKQKPSSKAYSDANTRPAESKIESLNSKDQRSSDTDNSTTFDSTATSSHSKTKSKKRKKRFHPAANFALDPSDAPTYQPPAAQSIKEMLAEIKREIHDDDKNVTDNVLEGDTTLEAGSTLEINTESGANIASTEIDNLPSALKAYLRTPEQRQADIDAIKAESRLRWLAFYYLSRREHGKAELKQKLIDKEQNPDKIDALLEEFESKGYQSDYRTTLMLIRESIRKGRGRGRIKQDFYQKKIAMPSNIDELIDMANAESDEFREFVDDNPDSLVEGVDWLKLAVIARIKKYGDDIPTEQKDKAKQLRFLQYRGFNTDICFQALRYTLDNLEERF
ncbi:regulatory protein [Psychrobacter sp. PL19]|uniref:regulatory protein RecX n=1 Tax=Psychrobacter sp. PL19 TaxID=2760711 RepID=UPI001AEA36F4